MFHRTVLLLLLCGSIRLEVKSEEIITDHLKLKTLTLAGVNATLKCKVNEADYLNVTWTFENSKVPGKLNNDGTQVICQRVKGGEAHCKNREKHKLDDAAKENLVIMNVSVEDAGKYQCIVISNINNANTVTIDATSPTTEPKFTTTELQPSTTKEPQATEPQSTTIEKRVTTSDLQLTTTEKQVTSTEPQSTTIGELPTMTESQSTKTEAQTTESQSTTINSLVTDMQSTTTELQPSTTEFQSTNTEAQSTEPQSTTIEKPVTTTDLQLPTTEKQVTSTEPQSPTIEKQPTTTELQSTKTEEQTTEPQSTTIEKLVTTTDLQLPTTEKQVTSSEPPSTTTEELPTTTELQSTKTEAQTTESQSTTKDTQATTSNPQITSTENQDTTNDTQSDNQYAANLEGQSSTTLAMPGVNRKSGDLAVVVNDIRCNISVSSTTINKEVTVDCFITIMGNQDEFKPEIICTITRGKDNLESNCLKSWGPPSYGVNRDYGKKLCIISDKPGRVAIVCKATFSPDIDTTPPDLEFKYEGSYEVTGGGDSGAGHLDRHWSLLVVLPLLSYQH